MLSLRPVTYLDVQHYFVDFQKHSKFYELPPEEAEFMGAFEDDRLIGFFATVEYDDGDIEIQQGYLSKEFRHKDIHKAFMALLEQMCKRAGFKRVLLGTHNRFRAYFGFAKDLGYKPSHLTFVKEIV